MNTGLSGKVALVCAASKGLGRAAAAALAAEGARVAMCARDAETLYAAAREIREAACVEVLPLVADVSRGDDIDRLVRDTSAQLGRLDILVTNAGGPRSAPFDLLTDEEWHGAFELLLLSVVRLCRAAVPHMRRQGGGRIINITSVSAKQPIAGLMLSNALRPAVVGFSKTLSNELAKDGITVNCVSPGYTRTDRVVDLAQEAARREGVSTDAVLARTVADIPTGRLGEPAELASLIAFLASERAAYITGTTISVDGGFVKGLM